MIDSIAAISSIARMTSKLLVLSASLSFAACGSERASAIQPERDAGSGGSGGSDTTDGTAGFTNNGASGGSSGSAGAAELDAAAGCIGIDPRAHGALGDGQADDTEAFRKAAATGESLCIYKTDAHYKLTGAIELSASVFGVDQPELEMYGATGEYWKHVIFAVNDYTGPGLVISGLTLDGQWDGVGANGEWSHNIQVRGSKNVTIENNVLKNAYGDNVLLGGESHPEPSENVVIRNNQMSNPRRCNIALIFAKNVEISGNELAKNNDYVTAIDLEPNPYSESYGTYESVWDVEITNNVFSVPKQVAVMLYHFEWGYPPDGLAGGNVAVTGNTGSASNFFAQVGNWQNVSVMDNSVGSP